MTPASETAPYRWPDLPEEMRWAVESMERRLRCNAQSAEELRERAAELRAEAEATEIAGFREACLALADNYDATIPAAEERREVSTALAREREIREQAVGSRDRTIALARRGRELGLTVGEMAELAGYQRPYLQSLIGPRDQP